jgi:hypothetical protein
MSDEVITDLDRQIQEALAVDPSPDFQARVRIRLSEEPRLDRPGTGWLLSGVTGLAVVVAVLAVFLSSRDQVRPRPSDPVPPVTANTNVPAEPMPPSAVNERSTERVRRMPRGDATQTVLVPLSDRDAFRRFLQQVTEHPLTYSSLPDTRDDAPLSVPEIRIEPILIEPIDAAGE